MGSRIPIAALLAALALLAVPSARAADMAPAPGTTLIRLTETATANLPRDQLRAQLSVEAKGADAAKVQAEVNRRMAAALALAKKSASVTAETGGYSVYRVTALNEPPMWQAAQGMILTSKDFPALLALAGELQSRGLAMSGLEFLLSHESLAKSQSALTTKALAALRARAEAVARDLGMKVESYREIDVGNAARPGGFMPMMAASSSSRAGAAPPPAAEAGDVTVSLGVNAHIELAPAK
ncbi:MAG TPA: SIMPL domain-containing protein [Alphaproteobacteria bacterium]|nr:SIMPL domain-containing protein [Alphaproteobacteria bacterium]